MTVFTFDPIGVVHSPFVERVDAPRQPSAAEGVEATIELFAGRDFEHALEDVADWEYLWVLFVFHRNVEEARGWRPKVLPPRSTEKRGVFATRSPHRPNPIGMSVVKLVAIDGLVIRVRNVDILDGSPVLDLKPYVAYADAHPDAREGWLEARDRAPAFTVEWSARAAEQTAFVAARGVAIADEIARLLALGPQPHPYRRIRKDGDRMRLAFKEWRVFFRVDGARVIVDELKSGYRPKQLAEDETLRVHREFVARFS
jgi:tRNA-Thr(GGU) m(6)t(6)A37 methyltransferase TsaA